MCVCVTNIMVTCVDNLSYLASAHLVIAMQPFMRPGLGWQLLSGDFFTGSEGKK